MPAHRVDLHAEGRDPEVVQDVLGLDGEVDLLALRHVELRRGDLLAAVRVLVEERPGELLADHADLEGRLGRRLLDVREDDVGVGAQRHEQDRRDRGPDDLEARVAVRRRAVELLLARLHPEAPDGVEDDRRDEHEDRHGDDHQDVPQRVDRPGLLGGGGGEPVDQDPEARSRAATRARRSRCSAGTWPSSRRALCTAAASVSALWLSCPMEAASYRTAGTEGTDARRSARAESARARR